MALDEVLLDGVAAGLRPAALRFWEWGERCLVLGSHQSLLNEVDLEAARTLGFGIARRMSGGGTMLAEPGRTITYSIYAPESLVAGMSFVASFAFLDSWAVAALRALGVPAGYRPINDIVSPAGKIGGAAQARRRGGLLHHTTIAYEIDPALVPRLIRIGRERLSPLGVRSAEKPVTPLSQFTPRSMGEVVEALADAFGGSPAELSAGELAAARALAETKYATRGWIERFP